MHKSDSSTAQCDADCIILSEFDEIEGPIVLECICPSRSSASAETSCTPASAQPFAVRAMAGDVFGTGQDAATELPKQACAAFRHESNGKTRHLFVQYFALWDPGARGLIRTFSIIHISCDATKRNLFFSLMQMLFGQVADIFQKGNALTFANDMQQTIDDIDFFLREATEADKSGIVEDLMRLRSKFMTVLNSVLASGTGIRASTSSMDPAGNTGLGKDVAEPTTSVLGSQEEIKAASPGNIRPAQQGPSRMAYVSPRIKNIVKSERPGNSQCHWVDLISADSFTRGLDALRRAAVTLTQPVQLLNLELFELNFAQPEANVLIIGRTRCVNVNPSTADSALQLANAAASFYRSDSSDMGVQATTSAGQLSNGVSSGDQANQDQPDFSHVVSGVGIGVQRRKSDCSEDTESSYHDCVSEAGGLSTSAPQQDSALHSVAPASQLRSPSHYSGLVDSLYNSLGELSPFLAPAGSNGLNFGGSPNAGPLSAVTAASSLYQTMSPASSSGGSSSVRRPLRFKDDAYAATAGSNSEAMSSTGSPMLGQSISSVSSNAAWAQTPALLRLRGHIGGQLLQNVACALLRGHCVVVTGKETIVRQAVVALSVLVPAPWTKRKSELTAEPICSVIPWREQPISLPDIATVKLVGMPKPTSSRPMNRTVKFCVCILDLEEGKETFTAPPTGRGVLLRSVLGRGKKWPSKEAYLAHVRHQIVSIGRLVLLHYHSVVVAGKLASSSSANVQQVTNERQKSTSQHSNQKLRKSAINAAPMQVPKSAPNGRMNSEAAATWLRLVDEDLEMIEYLSHSIAAQQSRAQCDVNCPPTLQISLDYRPFAVSKQQSRR